MPMKLDLSSFERALISFDRGVKRALSVPGDEELRDAGIQRFEFTYELCHKMLKRRLEMTSPNPGQFDNMSFADLIRTGSEQGLLRSGWDKWRDFRQARTDTSHTYNEEKARRVFAILPDFLEEARFLLQQLQTRNP